MKKLVFVLFAGLLITSCDSNNSESSANFFNLETGNTWVYKRYNSSDNLTFVATNQIDSVKVTGTTEIEGETYSVLQHKSYVDNILMSEFQESLREDQNGHLIDPSGYVRHPGNDASYTAVRTITIADDVAGNVNYHMESPTAVTVEGQEYYVYPYMGNFFPAGSMTSTGVIFDQYEEGLGLVMQHCASVYGQSSYEDRLIYYDVN